jgi:metal-responsive CopG/Arc/MetJ family transcriptional regulator
MVDEEKQDKSTNIYFSDDELRMIDDIKKETGLRNRSDVIRQLIRKEHDSLLTKI